MVASDEMCLKLGKKWRPYKSEQCFGGLGFRKVFDVTNRSP